MYVVQAGKLTLGKINELGQFVSEVEPEPDIEKKKKGTFILKKRKEKEKVCPCFQIHGERIRGCCP